MIKQSLNSEYNRKTSETSSKTPVTMTSKSLDIFGIVRCTSYTEHLTVLKKRKNLLSKSGINWMINFIFEYFIRHGLASSWNEQFIPWRGHAGQTVPWLLQGMKCEVHSLKKSRHRLTWPYKAWLLRGMNCRVHSPKNSGLFRLCSDFFRERTAQFIPEEVRPCLTKYWKLRFIISIVRSTSYIL